MLQKKNQVLEGKYRDCYIHNAVNAYISIENGKRIYLNRETLERMESITEKEYKSLSSALGRGLLGAMILGPLGAVAALTARSKSRSLLVLYYKEGGRSLVEVDDELYRVLVRTMF